MKKREPWFCQHCKCIMDYSPSRDYYVCPRCGTIVTPGDSIPIEPDDEIGQLMADMASVHKPAEALPSGQALRKGGGGSSGKKKPAQKKDTTQQLYKKLFKQS